MAVSQKLRCVVERVASHGERVYTLTLRPERRAPKFRAGQFLHLAIDPYDPSRFWPESRVFSIASSPDERERLSLTYAVHGQFTARMERDLTPGREVWIKMPYGDFVIDNSGEVVLLAGGTGVTAFTAYLETLPAGHSEPVTLAYGARDGALLIYRESVERCAARVPTLRVIYFVEEGPGPDSATLGGRVRGRPGRVSLDAVWPALLHPATATFYISGPPAMLQGISRELRARDIAPEAIRIDAWE